MATYREIHGKAIKSLDTDPSATTDEGQIWYNTASNTFKTIVNLEAWSSVAPGIYSKNTAGGAGTSTAAVVYGGASSSGTVYHNETVEYNGTGFSASGNLGTARQDGGSCGIQTAALFVGGEAPPGNVAVVEEYNGSTWSEETNIPTSDRGWGSLGLQGAAVMVGGATAPTTKCFEYDGSSWTTGGALTDGRRLSGMGCGTEPAGLVAGGDPNSDKTETYNGSAWTAGNTLNTGRQQGKMSGPQTAGLVWGGETPSLTTATEKFDGTSWTTSSGTLGTAVKNNSGNKDTTSGTSALNVYGNIPGDTSGAEEYNSSANIITPTSWAAGENLGTGRYGAGIGQSQTACGLAGLQKASPTAAIGDTELYDGTSWSPSGSLAVPRYRMSGCGTQTAGLGMGGYGGPGGPGYKSNVEEFSGSSWTSQTALPGGCQFGSANGPQTAAIYCMYNTPGGDSAEGLDYNGTSWTAGDNMVTTRRQGCLIGAAATQTAAIAAGGNVSPPSPSPNVKTTESYNGSSWTTVNSMNTGRHASGSSGIQGNADIFGSDPTTNYPQVTTENYNGTTWSSRANASTARVAVHNGGGGTGAAIFMGGNPGSNSTEEFTDASTALNVKTLTQS